MDRLIFAAVIRGTVRHLTQSQAGTTTTILQWRRKPFLLNHILRIPYSAQEVGIRLSSSASSLPTKSVVNPQQDSGDTNDEDEERKRREASWRTMKLGFIAFGASFTFFAGYTFLTFGAPERDPIGNPIEDEFSHMPLWKQYIFRAYHVLDGYKRYIREPSREKLLPDPVSYPYYQPPYTLILELTDVLVHPDWTYNTGWRFIKRPGLEYLLKTLYGHYEIVVFTAEQKMTVDPLLNHLDPENLITYRLVRDATHFLNGHHVKNLNNLNRDLQRVVVVDWCADNLQLHPENLFRIKRWDGNNEDQSLIDLANFLKTIVDCEVKDVREVLHNYSVYEDPIREFRLNQQRCLEVQEQESQAQQQREHQKLPKAKMWTPSFLNRKPQ